MALLSELIPLPALPLISLVGAGGKTTTMYTLASELAGKNKRVITTTTTNIYFPRPGETDTFIVAAETPVLIKMVQAAWKQHRRITVASKMLGAGKVGALEPGQPYELLTKSGANAVIVETDGARHRTIKAPAAHEPVVPPQTNIALLLMSAEAINQPLNSEVAHRPERIATVLDIQQGDILTPALIATLMTSEQGALKAIPADAQIYLLITHAAAARKEDLQELAHRTMLSSSISGVYCSPQPGEWSAI
jgi:probable selenium-dependent hydroxylase accessory protein YqeC